MVIFTNELDSYIVEVKGNTKNYDEYFIHFVWDYGWMVDWWCVKTDFCLIGMSSNLWFHMAEQPSHLVHFFSKFIVGFHSGEEEEKKNEEKFLGPNGRLNSNQMKYSFVIRHTISTVDWNLLT